ncbi:farnesyl pyrophosphate synthase [Ceratitis capitata]|uniref:farnesyl pyrophosphate synthase n=1 Tax=Ceratitis capitata TaxID=7213 RepID=UPI0006189095|nr:farnesyl pyrophosphate synthase [Ceratitis capitata]
MFSLLRNYPQIQATIACSTVIKCGGVNQQISKTHTKRAMSLRQDVLAPGRHSTKQTFSSKAQQNYFGTRIREISTLERHNGRALMSEEEMSNFMAVYPDILNELTEIAERYKSEEAAAWFRKSLEYNLSLTNNKNGLITVLTYKSLANSEVLNAENLKLARILGWCFEMMICFILITDDIVDRSTTRRGKICWHHLDGVGLSAINDALLIENGLYELLHKHFRHLDCYADLLELFQQNIFKCICGQTLDILLTKRNVTTFNMNTYKSLVLNKTSCHFFYLPIFLGLHLAGVRDPEVFKESEAIIYDLGNYFQAQNDFLDVFGNPEITGKIGSDIQSNKCSWLAVKCMEHASEEQKAVMAECYGQNDPEKVARVLQVYQELNMPSLHAKYEEEKYNRILRNIQQTSDAAPKDVLLEVLNQIYVREIK